MVTRLDLAPSPWPPNLILMIFFRQIDIHHNAKEYRPGPANLQFLLYQNLGILVIFSTFKCGIVSVRAFKMTNIADFDLLKLPNFT